jgi:hypothetical protein
MDDESELEHLRRENARLQEMLDAKQQVATPATLLNNLELIQDLCRFAEGIYTEAQVRKRHHFDEATWERLGNNEPLFERVEEEKIHRMRSGATKRELAQKHIVKGPDVLEKIMCDESANSRHRIDSIKALDDLAANGPKTTPMEDRIVISIDLTADAKLKAIEPDPNDVIVIETELPMIAKKNNNDDGSRGGAW